LAGAGSLALGATILDTGALLGWDPAQAAPADGTLRVAMTAAAVPLSNGCPDQGAEGLRFMGITIYDQLVEWDLTQSDKAAPLKPGLATSWKTDPADPTVWHFEIRPGVKFHDGHVLTAEDVAFSFDRAFKTDAPWFDARASSQASLRVPSLLSWKVEGPMSFSLKTKIADSTIPFCLTWVGITHRGAWEAAGKSWDTYLQHAVGTGPWKLDTFSLRERATLSRFADHWDPARVPKAQNLVLLPVPEASTRIAALRSGQVNFVEAPAPDAVESLKAAGFQVLTNVYPHNWTWQLSMLEGSPFRDIRVRKALNLAIDRSGMKDLLNGLMLEGKGLMTPSSPWYGKPSFELKFDPAAAKALLAEAGFPPGKLNFKVAISSSGSGQMQPVPMNEFLQANLKDVGVNVEFQVMEWNTLLGVMRDGAKAPSAKGISAINVSYSGFDPYNGFFRLLKTSMQAPVGTNWGYYSDPQMDAIFDEAYKEMDPVKQSALLAQAHTKIVDDALFLFVAHDLNPRALAPNLHGFVEAQSWFQSLTPIAVG
jgi:ABC-type transport system substrate-binding protein